MLRSFSARFALAFFLLTGFACAQNHRTTPPRAQPVDQRPSPRPNTTAPSHTVAPQTQQTPRAATPKVPTPNGPPVTYSRVEVDAPYVAITFDDGPHKTLTPRLLDLLARRGIKATFFVLGQRVEAEPAVARRIVAEGHEIAEHSWSHPNLGKMSDANVESQLRRSGAAILKATGVAPTLFRPPYGSFSERQRRWAHQKFGYPTILWDVDPLDWKRPGPSVVAERILTKTKPGSIILVHDIHSQSIDAMPQVLDTLSSRGYRFVTVTELIRLGEETAARKAAAAAAATAQPTPADVRVLPAQPVHPSTPPAPAATSPAIAPDVPGQ